MKAVYIINGFLESGKTEFITYTLAQPYFQMKGTTLICSARRERWSMIPRSLRRAGQ